ncbi:MAG: protein jag [Thermotogaceae bacterium]|nr:protein jag [Thermotogaceae bacterium]
MKKIRSTAPTVEEAIEKVIKEYDLKDDEYTYEIVEKGFKGILGFFSKEATVDITIKRNFYARKIKEFLLGIVKSANLDVKINVTYRGKTFYVKIKGTGIGKLIGKHGKTLGALQHILTIFVNRLSDIKLNVVIDAGEYRERRKKQLETIAENAIREVVRNKGKVVLDPMFSFERKIVHEIVKKYKGVRSYSIGVEPYRKVVIEYFRKHARTNR